MVRVNRIHEDLKEMLGKGGYRGEIQSVFQHVINIKSETGLGIDIISVLTYTEEDFPQSLILDSLDFSKFSLFLGERVYEKDGYLYMGGSCVTFSTANSYTLSLCPYGKKKNLSKNLAKAKNQLRLLEEPPRDNFGQVLADALEKALAALKFALEKGDIEAFKEAAIGLLGLGLGLTPTGDDYLTAFLTIMMMKESPLEPYRVCVKEILEASEKRTNLLSSSYLKRAAKGLVRTKVSDFLEAMLYGEDISFYLNELLTIGSSSGRDLAYGMVFILEILKNLDRS